MKELLLKISDKIKKARSAGEAAAAGRDMYFVCLEVMKTDASLAVFYLVWLSGVCEEIMKTAPNSEIREIYALHLDVLRAAAPYHFESYLLYVEHRREPEKKFYPPRRRVLRLLVDDLQDLADGRIDFLGISLPPRVGKSTLCIFFMTWVMGRRPEVANVMSGHSDKLTDGFYREILSIINDNVTYAWADVFPNVKLADSSAKNESIDLGKKKRFPTLTCRPIEGTLTGAVEIGEGGVLYVDDLIKDLEESLSISRLDAKYDAYLNQLKDRKKDGARELMVGTRWGVYDPLGRIEEQYRGNPRYRFRVIPALDESGKSNFDYAYGKGFSTEYYLDMKASVDDATWCAKYMGAPYIREGLLFPEAELKTYNGVLPDGDGVRLAVCDVAWGGGDSLSMPVLYVFGEDVYVHDVIFNRGDKTVTYPLVIGKLRQHRPNKARFEANNGGEEYADRVDDALQADGVHVNIFSVRSKGNQSKLARITQYAPEIKRFYFLAEKYRSDEYRAFMRELTTFTVSGKNPHDDAPDSLAMAAEEIFHSAGSVTVFERPF